MVTSVQAFLERNSKKFPDKIAVIYKNEKLSYKELDTASTQCANALIALGATIGDRVVISTSNKLLEVVFCFGILKAGATEVSIDYSDTTKNCRTITKCVGARFLVVDTPEVGGERFIACDRNFFVDQSKILPLLEREQKSIAFIQYTSGSTGEPKGIVLSHANFIAPLSENEYIKNRKDDVLLLQMPLAYAYGKSILLEYIAAGATIFLEDKIILPQTAFNFIKENSITSLEGPPSFYEMLLKFSNIKKERLDRVRYISIGGGAATIRLVSELRAAQPQAIISNRYGMTETASVVSRIEFNPGMVLDKLGSCGTRAPYIELKIVDEELKEVHGGVEGELLVRGKNVMMGIVDEGSKIMPEFDHGWFRTGDIGKIDEDGYLYINSRKSQIIKSQGYRISPAVIEDVLMKIPAIKNAAVVGVPDEVYGEIVQAFIVKGHDDLTESDILTFCNRHMPSFMIPRVVRFIDNMPLTFSGKVDRGRLSF